MLLLTSTSLSVPLHSLAASCCDLENNTSRLLRTRKPINLLDVRVTRTNSWVLSISSCRNWFCKAWQSVILSNPVFGKWYRFKYIEDFFWHQKDVKILHRYQMLDWDSQECVSSRPPLLLNSSWWFYLWQDRDTSEVCHKLNCLKKKRWNFKCFELQWLIQNRGASKQY